jgi:uncharacterized protein DUF4397
MRKVIWTTLVIVSVFVGLFIIKAVGASAQPTTRTASAVISVSNSAPDVGAIDVYIDHQLAKANLSTTDPAISIEVAPGNHLIDVFPAGQTVVLIKTTELAVAANHTYRFSLSGRTSDWSVALGAAAQ